MLYDEPFLLFNFAFILRQSCSLFQSATAVAGSLSIRLFSLGRGSRRVIVCIVGTWFQSPVTTAAIPIRPHRRTAAAASVQQRCGGQMAGRLGVIAGAGGEPVAPSPRVLQVKGRRRQRRVLLPKRILRVELAHHLDRLCAARLVAAQVPPPGLAANVVNLLVRVGTSKEDGADGDVAGLNQERQRRQAGVVAKRPRGLPKVLVVDNVELAEELKEVAVGVVDHHVKCELLEHDLLVG